jgi:hypothetical protein
MAVVLSCVRLLGTARWWPGSYLQLRGLGHRALLHWQCSCQATLHVASHCRGRWSESSHRKSCSHGYHGPRQTRTDSSPVGQRLWPLQEGTLAIPFEPAVGRLKSSKLAAILEMITHVAAREKVVLWLGQARKQKFAEETVRFVTQNMVEIRQIEKLADILVGSQASPDRYHFTD